MSRKDLIRVTATVGGVPVGRFRTFSGGEITSAELKTVKAAGEVELARGGRKSVGNVTIGREDDGTLNLSDLAAKVGNADMVVNYQPLDENLNPFGKAIGYFGKLVAIRPGDGDAQADTDTNDFELEMSCHGVTT